MNADGDNIRRLTHHPTADWFPDWSLNEESIVFDSKVEENSDIYSIDIDGSNRHRLTDHPASDWDPIWMPAGFLAVSPTAEKQTILWGKLKQPVDD